MRIKLLWTVALGCLFRLALFTDAHAQHVPNLFGASPDSNWLQTVHDHRILIIEAHCNSITPSGTETSEVVREYHQSPDGGITRITRLFSQGTQDSFATHFDRTGKMLEASQFDPEDMVKRIDTVRFDGSGHLIPKTVLTTITGREIVPRLHPDAASEVFPTPFVRSGIRELGAPTPTDSIRRGPNGDIVFRGSFNKNGTPHTVYTRTPDGARLVTSEFSDEGILQYTTVTTYSQSLKPIMIDRRDRQGGEILRHSYLYNKKDDLIYHVMYVAGRPTQTEKFRYYYADGK